METAPHLTFRIEFWRNYPDILPVLALIGLQKHIDTFHIFGQLDSPLLLLGTVIPIQQSHNSIDIYHTTNTALSRRHGSISAGAQPSSAHNASARRTHARFQKDAYTQMIG